MIALVGGDVVALMVFAAIGRGSHGEAAGLAAIGEVAQTAAPFLIGWLVTSPWLGAFRPEATAAPAKMLRTTALAWCAAVVAGSLLRALFIGRFSPPSFYIVTFIAALVILGGWRGLFALWEARRDSR
ncbi:DUF3054 domain-containing protein [Oscillochloris sp. ZM17-4]|uniref:DUF3054 domain-containing protein n=1 Tax=Oscillochloris sp. ZM17-4 TaxID=2866714 RepID=UPI001C734E28|nr:DUF3054 domain-containing protein [Oscillochloris sp. ZM17-4]MBX0329546.1 DUF3054 domain-containing protein [Oscillochloris sp. ZM17-4]